MRQVFTWFSTFCMSLPYLCPILVQTIRLRKDNSKIINSSFSPACLRLCATARSENIRYLLQIKSYLRFRVCSVRHLGCFYTVAKNFYTISRIRLCYSIPMVRGRRPQCSKISETAWPIKAKFYVEPPWVRVTIFFFAACGSHDQDGGHAHIW